MAAATSILPKSLDYTDRDFDSLRLRLQSLIRSVFPDWTDFNVANFGDILLELMAHVGDVLGKYQDAQARESRIVTATQRKNILALVKLLNYQPQGAAAAVVDLVLTLKAPAAGSVTIGVDASPSTADITSPIVFHPQVPLVIAPGQTTVTLTVENAERQNDTYTSTGLPNQTFPLRVGPYIDGSAVVTATDGAYTQVDSLLDSITTDRHFTVAIDQNDKATITVGNGINGMIPAGSVSIDYKTGGGAAGNVDPGTVNRFPGTFTDAFGNSVTIACTNPLKAISGRERQSIPSIQAHAPRSARATDRSVGREDFEIHAEDVPGVARALLTTSNEDLAVAENSGILYIVPTGGGVPTQALKDAVLAQVTTAYPHTTTFRLAVQDPIYRVANVAMTVYFRKGVYPPTGALAIRNALVAFFAVDLPDGSPNATIDFGLNYLNVDGDTDPAVAYSDVFDTVGEVAYVRKIGGKPGDFVINGTHDDMVLAVREFPKLGTVAIIDGDTGQTL